MNTHFHRQRNTTDPRFVGLGMALFFFVLIFAIGLQIPSFLRAPAYALAAPIWEAQHSAESVAANVWGSFFASGTELDDLREENERLNTILLKYKTLANENAQLKLLLGRKDANGEGVVAGVLARPQLTPYDTFVVDVGSDDGIKVGDTVLAGEHAVLGYVDDVYTNTSHVTLLSSPGDMVAVVVHGTEEAVVVNADGNGGGNFTIRLPQDTAVLEGTVVTLPGLDGEVVGYIASIERVPTDAFQTLNFRTPINLFTVQHLLIVPTNTYDIPEDSV